MRLCVKRASVVAVEMPVLCAVVEDVEVEKSSARGLRARRVETDSGSGSASWGKAGESSVVCVDTGDREEVMDAGVVFSGGSELWEISVSEGVSSPRRSSPSDVSPSSSKEPSWAMSAFLEGRVRRSGLRYILVIFHRVVLSLPASESDLFGFLASSIVL